MNFRPSPFALAILTLLPTSHLLAAPPQKIGVWVDHDMLIKCELHLEREQGKVYAVNRNCLARSERFEGDRNLFRQTGKTRFAPVDKRLGDWFYAIAASGELEVRDAKGVVRTIPSKEPRTATQHRASLKSSGVSIGMDKDEVLASSWGKPVKVNRTQTRNGIREQWVYSGGYLYFDGDTLVTIQN